MILNYSSKTSIGTSLNILLKDGTVTNELWCTLLSFCVYITAFSSDVKKIRRELKMHSSHQDLLIIVWKFSYSTDSPMKVYRLTTGTYGTTCAPFLVTRTLQLSENEIEIYQQLIRIL
ncbi:hypothetical protein TNIN_177021 [Trichonephila inaurata madagascariensis]|uniref:Uncharacterized protein n=1 Tax=Trichonephila inaurata madagascariensis TaxID=2747483 RepID=A0A8X7CKF0_9ARAC|nr:hypothetical protein TNIN_177021 [Trichonephila inaurata madagascariensis]